MGNLASLARELHVCGTVHCGRMPDELHLAVACRIHTVYRRTRRDTIQSESRPFSAEGYSEMSTENQMSTEIPAYSEIIQAPVLIFNIFSSQNPQFPYMKKPNLPMVGLE